MENNNNKNNYIYAFYANTALTYTSFLAIVRIRILLNKAEIAHKSKRIPSQYRKILSSSHYHVNPILPLGIVIVKQKFFGIRGDAIFVKNTPLILEKVVRYKFDKLEETNTIKIGTFSPHQYSNADVT